MIPFNVVCSASNLSISKGTEVVFFPLLPKKYGKAIHASIKAKKYLIYPDYYFQPFCLPIKGIYNEMGSIEQIEEDENTQVLEAFFGMPIQLFVDGVGRSYLHDGVVKEQEVLYQHLSGMFVHRSIYEAMVQFDLKDKHVANGYLTEEVARYYGFEVVEKEKQAFLDGYYPLLMRKKGFPYDLKIGEHGAILIHQMHQEYYVFGINPNDGQDILKYWEEATGTSVEETFPKDVDVHHLTKEDCQRIEAIFERLTGSKMGWHMRWNERYSFHSVVEFSEVYQKLTGERLDLSPWYELSQYDKEYERFHQAIQKELVAEGVNGNTIDYYKAHLAETASETQRRMIEQVILFQEETMVDNQFGEHLNDDVFLHFFKEMDYFKTLYLDCLKKGELKENLRHHKAFYMSMYRCNKIYAPALKGGQFGNREASMMLLEKSMEVLREQIKS